jgi:hypothetical protein
MFEVLLAVVLLLAGTVRTVWIFSSFIVKFFSDAVPETVHNICHHLASELRPFYLPAFFVSLTYQSMTGILWNWMSILGNATAILCWFIYKDTGDDRWKRRRKKLREKIKRVGAKLVVVPATGNA